LTTVTVRRQGRTLTAETWGAPSGAAVFLLHGTPGSRLGPRPRASVLYRLGIRLIAYDRPGYGGSERKMDRTVADAAADVAAIADHLGIDRFAVVGRSGGGPHALACAALLAEQVTRAAALVSLAPRNAAGLDWYAGMGDSNVTEYSAAENARHGVAARLAPHADSMRTDPLSHIGFLDPELHASDRRVIADYGIRSMLSSNFAEALKNNEDGWVDDVLAFVSPWGFDVSRISAPVLLWHGADDVFSPVGHTRWLAGRIRNAEVVIEPNTAHFGAVAALPGILRWLAGGSGPAARGGEAGPKAERLPDPDRESVAVPVRAGALRSAALRARG
jgi:pimeloyl-ACP methyl ester carboxylesterase